MHVTVDVVGEGERELAVDADATYADVVREAGFHPQEASVLVDGSPVPEDATVDAERVRLLRLIKGGDGSATGSDGDGGTTAPSDADAASDPGARADLEFTLPNAGPGPDPFTLTDCEADLAVLLFHRHYLCGNCRKQVTAVTERYGEFAERDVEVVSILPATEAKAAEWADDHGVSYPLVADPEKAVAEQYDQPVKWGIVGRTFELLGRMPQVAVIDLRREPELLWIYGGKSPVDRPEVDDLLAEVDKFR